MKTEMLYILVCCLFLIGCNGKSNKENHADVSDTIFEAISPVDNETDIERENLWKEANRYKASITDTTFLRTRHTLPPEEEIVGQPIFKIVDQMPEFPGGMDKLLQFINDNMQYPAEARKKEVQGRVVIQFIVNENGYITEPTIMKSVDPSLDEEALRIIKMLPQWKPGTLHGKAVQVKYTVPVTFRLDKIKETPKNLQSTTQILRPVPRNIPIGKNMNPDSLSMKTEYACYPLSTTEVKIFVTNHSRQKYTCGNDYSLAFYNGGKRQWETLPTDPVIEDIGWVLLPKYPPHQQTIKLYTSEVPNRPGKYRIYKAFYRDEKEVTYAEFEMVDKKGVEQIRKRIDDYWMDRMNDEKDTTAQNIQSTSIYDNDTIGVLLMNNSQYFQEMFRRKVVSYSAVNHGRVQSAIPFIAPAFLDTLQISMKTDRPVYPAGTKSVSVSLNNNNSRTLFFGEDYIVARKEGNQWLLLNGNNAWTDI